MRVRTDQERKLATALGIALDVLTEHVGGFDNWPVALKDAFADAIIDTSPPTAEEIAWTEELAKRYGWEKL